MTRRDVLKRFSEAVGAGDTAAIARISESGPGIVNAANAHRNVPLGVAIGTGRLHHRSCITPPSVTSRQ